MAHMGAVNVRNLRDSRGRVKSANGHRDWVTGRRLLRDCRHSGSLTVCSRFQTCRQLQGWVSLGHDVWGCGGFWFLSGSTSTTNSLCVLLRLSENLRNTA